MLISSLSVFWLVLVFVGGYLFIMAEHLTTINKATAAILMAVLSWLLVFIDPGVGAAQAEPMLMKVLAEVSQVVFFLLCALTIVEIINVHRGFDILKQWFRVRSKRSFLWIICLATFFLSALLDNLTTTVVILSMLRTLVPDKKDRLLIGSAVVIAANAGGAWTPLGDITTTMLWIGGQISSGPTMTALFLPSLTAMVVALICFSIPLKGHFPEEVATEPNPTEPFGKLIFALGIFCILLVPIFKLLTGLPPFIGMLFGLGVMWLATDYLHGRYDREHLRLPSIIAKVDLSGPLFFLGILLTVGALSSTGLLTEVANYVGKIITKDAPLTLGIGAISSVVDNVPLVAAVMKMYEQTTHPMNAPFWQMIAYCAGVGGNILLIGSAAGVAFMSMEKVSFTWYLRKATIPALFGYLAGFGVYLLFR